MPCPVVITVFQISLLNLLKKPPASFYIRKSKFKKGSGQTGIADPVASISKEQLPNS